MENKEFYTLSVEETLKNLNTSEKGLDEKEATKRLAENGKNELQEVERKSLLRRFFDQLTDTMILVLIAAAFISAAVNIYETNYAELFESWLILLIVILNAIIWLTQESKAHEALEALKNMNKPEADVIRNWKQIKIKQEDIVIGDIVKLEAWDIVPADLRLTNAISLKIEEANLTWESLPVSKNSELEFKGKTPLWDRRNMAFSSSIVAYWRWEWVVVATWMNTEVWKIAGMLQNTEDSKTPLQVQLAKTAKYLSYIVLVIAAIIFAASIINVPTWETMAENIIDSFMTAVAIAVAAIPEWLPAVVTIVLAISVKRMSERKAIVRNLPAVETLGSCEVICTDKTGTLTLNQMTVKKLYTLSKWLYYENKIDDKDKSVIELINWMVLNNDTTFWEKDKLLGDPTETALTAYALLAWMDVKKFVKDSPRAEEIPFDSKRKMMSTVNTVNKKKTAYIKWAFDMMLEKCKFIQDGNKVRTITKEDIKKLIEANDDMASNALRVLAVAYKVEKLNTKNLENDLIFVWLVWMIDPPRKEVPDAVARCKEAWIEAVMITWDHLETAVAIAKEIWIFEDWDLAITWAELDKLSEKQFEKELRKYRVFARVSPENKVRIVKAFKNKKLVVAMTGDWVNDAPSIKIADIWVGMWITWTDVSKGAADIVLADDNFATIVNAVEEWRKAYSNIQKAVQYLLSANIAEVVCLFVATIFLKVPFLTPVMILWINLVTDSLPALALWTEKAEADIMKKKPRKSWKSLFSWQTGKDIMIQWAMQTLLTLFSFCMWTYVITSWIAEPHEWITMAFITLSLIQLFHSYNLRSQRQSLFSSNPFTNKFLNLSFLVWIGLIALVIFTPYVRDFFDAVPLSWREYFISVLCAILIIPFVEVQKMIERRVLKD